MQNSTPLPAPRPSQNETTLPIVTLSVCLRDRLQGLIDEANRRTLPNRRMAAEVAADVMTPHDHDEFAFYDLLARLELMGPDYVGRAVKLLQAGQVIATADYADDGIAF